MNKINVLLVDDEKEFLEITREYIKLSNSNIILDTEISALKALEKAEQNEYDVIVSDYVMGEITGLELFDKIRKKGVKCPFIIITGRGKEDLVINAMNMGVEYYLVKGVNPEVFFRELEQKIIACAENKIQNIQKLREERFTQFAEKMRFGLAVLSMENYQIKEVNQAFADMVKYSIEELHQKTLFDVLSDTEQISKIPSEKLEKGYSEKRTLITKDNQLIEKKIHFQQIEIESRKELVLVTF